MKDGTRYFKLYCKCPNCTENGENVPPSFWYCESCGGEIYLGDNAHFIVKSVVVKGTLFTMRLNALIVVK